MGDMEFRYPNPDEQDRSKTSPAVIGVPDDPNAEFIIRDPQYGDQIAEHIDFYYVSPSSLNPAIETGDETQLREHIVPQEETGWFRVVNIVGYAAIRPRSPRSKNQGPVLVRVRDFKETGPYRPKNT